jgi:hypothetical protein
MSKEGIVIEGNRAIIPNGRGDPIIGDMKQENAVMRFNAILSLLLAAALPACTTEQAARGVYEGSRAYNKATQSTPLEKSKSDLPDYDQYEKERRGGEAK